MNAVKSSTMLIKNGSRDDLEGVVLNDTGVIHSLAKPLLLSQDLSQDDTVKAFKKLRKRIITFDGGGVRGKFSLTLASRLEKELAIGLKLGEVFDLFGGTSAGAITSLMLNKPSYENSKSPVYSAQYINDNFDELAGQIFPNNLCARISQFCNYWICDKAKYDKQGINNYLDKYIGDTLLEDSINEVVIPTYQRSPEMHTWFITRKIAREIPFFQSLTMKKMILMSTAAPTYFDAEDYKKLLFWDGGLFANDPTEAAWITAKNNYGPNSEYVICSFGTGITPTKFDTDPTIQAGIYTIAPAILDLFMNASVKSVDQSMINNFGNRGYYRWQADINRVELDNSSSEILTYLEEQANALLDDPKNQEQWEEMLQELRKTENTEPYAQSVQTYN